MPPGTSPGDTTSPAVPIRVPTSCTKSWDMVPPRPPKISPRSQPVLVRRVPRCVVEVTQQHQGSGVPLQYILEPVQDLSFWPVRDGVHHPNSDQVLIASTTTGSALAFALATRSELLGLDSTSPDGVALLAWPPPPVMTAHRTPRPDAAGPTPIPDVPAPDPGPDVAGPGSRAASRRARGRNRGARGGDDAEGGSAVGGRELRGPAAQDRAQGREEREREGGVVDMDPGPRVKRVSRAHPRAPLDPRRRLPIAPLGF